ncbi:MAG: EF-Tu/IF-2/RF-3 family GTPase [Candidatus Hydrothermarchaeales archaeon]
MGECMAEEEVKKEMIGKVFTYFSNANVAGIKLEGTLKVGDTIHIQGHTTNFEQTVDSMQIDRDPVEQAGAGASVGIKVKERVRPNDKIYKVQG